MNIVIAVVTNNRPKKLYRLLYSLKPQLKKNHLVFILENGSDTITKNSIKNLGITNFILSKSTTANIPKARNKVIKQVKKNHELILFIDDDCIPEPFWIQKYEKIFTEKEINIVQGKSVSIPSDNIYAQLTNQLYSLWFKKNTKKNTTKIIDTKNVGIKTKIFGEFWFEEKLQFATDIELATQLYSQKNRIYYDSSILVFHEERLSLKQFIKHRKRLSKAYRLIVSKYPNYFSSASIIEKYKYIWQNLHYNPLIKLYLLLVLTFTYFLTIQEYIIKNTK